MANLEFVQGNDSRERFPLENGVFRTIEGSSQIGMLLRTVSDGGLKDFGDHGVNKEEGVL